MVDLNFISSFLKVGDHIIYSDNECAPAKSYQITRISNNKFYHNDDRIFKLRENELYNFSINANGVFTIHVINRNGFYVCCFKGTRYMYSHIKDTYLKTDINNISANDEIAVYLI